MEDVQELMFRKGYAAGYRDGVKQAMEGQAKQIQGCEISDMPIEVAELSARARHCLIQAGCADVADVARLSKHKISTMRGLGKKTASEVARWLARNGIYYTAWFEYV